MSLTPIAVQTRLLEVEASLELVGNDLASIARAYIEAMKDRHLARATAYAGAVGTATERKIVADAAAAQVGIEEEATFEARKLALKVLETRANIGMSLLRSFGRS